MIWKLTHPLRLPEICEIQGDFMPVSRTESVFETVSKLGYSRKGEHKIDLREADLAALIVRAYFHGAYRLNKEPLRHPIEDVFAVRDALCDFGESTLYVRCAQDISKELEKGLILAQCEGYARTLGNLPNNFLRTEQMADYARKMADFCGLGCRALKNKALEDLGCGGILAVNQGSNREAQMVLLTHPGKGESIALVGKGVMFDSGGYHLKDLDGMNGMQMDMCGAAVVLESMEYLARTGSQANVMAVTPLVENVISPDALKMGDVISTLGGKTVEVYFTDAEGRLILCDGLSYAQKLGANKVIDLGTLTYGCQSALGDEIGGYFCNDEALAHRFEEVFAKCGEGFWRLPLAKRYHDALRWSQTADIANYAPGKGAAASMAACFLEEFILPGTSWIHLDAVGPSVRRGGSDWEVSGARGFGVATLTSIVEEETI